MSRRKPYSDHAGYVASRRNPISGGWCVIYRAPEAQLDPTGGNWVTVCEIHGTLCNHTSLTAARASMKSPDFCEACQQTATDSRARQQQAWDATYASSQKLEASTQAARQAIRDLLTESVKPAVDSGYWQCLMGHLARVEMELMDVPQLKGLHDLLDSLIKRN